MQFGNNLLISLVLVAPVADIYGRSEEVKGKMENKIKNQQTQQTNNMQGNNCGPTNY